MNGRRGFTLLEVLVATVVLAVAITGLLSALTGSLNNISHVTEADRAAVLARRKMDELITVRELPRNQIIEGRWDQATGVEGGWRAQVTPFEAPPDAGPGALVMDRVQLEIWWMSSMPGVHGLSLTPTESCAEAAAMKVTMRSNQREAIRFHATLSSHGR